MLIGLMCVNLGDKKRQTQHTDLNWHAEIDRVAPSPHRLQHRARAKGRLVTRYGELQRNEIQSSLQEIEGL
jgi:hypothetical protein